MNIKDIELNSNGNEIEELKKIIMDFGNTIKNQNELIVTIKNQYIILENNFDNLKYKTEEYLQYKKLFEIIMKKINHNPISSLWFIYRVKKKLKQ